MRQTPRSIVFALVFLALWVAGAGASETLKVAVLKFGTVNWELDVIRHNRIDMQVQGMAGKDYVFIPYSKSVGGLMVSANSPVQSLADLQGQKIGIAGGPVDKS